MKLHANAALSLNKRRLLVQRVVAEGWSLVEAAKAAETSEPTARKWVARYLAEGEAGLVPRPPSRPQPHVGGSNRGDLRAAASSVHRR